MSTPPASASVPDPVEYVGGIDEAGRGPVLGPMVYSIFFLPKRLDDEKFLQARFKVQDSKVLNAKRRDQIYRQIHRTDEVKTNYCLKSLSAATLAQGMQRRIKYNLNAISHDTASDLVQEAKEIIQKRGGVLKHVFVDTVGHPRKYQGFLESRHPEIGFTVCPKADAKYASVSAASIVAKVTRDRTIEALAKTQSIPMGSGYPGDAKTREFIDKSFDEVFGYKQDFVRYSWETIQLMFDEQGVYVEWSDEDEEVDDAVPEVEVDTGKKRKGRGGGRRRKKKGRKRTGVKRRRKERMFAVQEKRKRRKKTRSRFFRQKGLAHLAPKDDPFFVLT